MTQSVADAADVSRAPTAPYAPPYPIHVAPLLVWPVKPAALFRYLFGFPGFLWPYYSSYSIIAALTYFYLPPTQAETATFHIGWIGAVALKYAVTISIFAGVLHFFLYVLRTQGTAFKYHPKWPAKNDRRFLFKDQVLDNVFWNFACAVPFATMFEVIGRWLYANGYVREVTLADNPGYCVLLFMALPLWAFAHFWAVHRLIHWPPLYKAVHYLHHKNVNINPWSGLAMHPVESCIFFSGAAIFYVIPAHPLFILFYLNLLVMMTPIDHSGFHRILFGNGRGWDTDFYMHYLHHKYFEVNYAFDTSFPMDIWLGTFHDGTSSGQEAMNRRRRAALQSE